MYERLRANESVVDAHCAVDSDKIFFKYEIHETEVDVTFAVCTSKRAARHMRSIHYIVTLKLNEWIGAHHHFTVQQFLIVFGLMILTNVVPNNNCIQFYSLCHVWTVDTHRGNLFIYLFYDTFVIAKFCDKLYSRFGILNKLHSFQ